MISLLMLLGVTATGADEVTPENWDCATPLIEKDYKQAFPVMELADRIADECAHPFKSEETNQSRLEIQRTVYRGRRTIFVDDIAGQVLSRLQKDAVRRND
jgi:hypothetical protein